MSTNTISSLFEIYLHLRTHELSAGTVGIYRYALGRLTAAVGDVDPAGILPITAMQFWAALAGQCKSPTTANMYLRAVKAFFRWLVAAEVIDKTPFKAVKFLKETACGKPIYSPDEVERLMRACLDDHWRLMVALAITAGLRRGEILNLTVGEVDYVAGQITLRPKIDTATTWGWTLKDTESRTVPINGFVERYLLKVHAELPDGQPYLCLRPRRYQSLMRLHRAGKLHHETAKCPMLNFLRGFSGICARAGVGYRTFHALRGSALTIMAENGLQPHELQAIAGHSDFRTTYTHYIRPSSHLSRARSAAYGG